MPFLMPDMSYRILMPRTSVIGAKGPARLRVYQPSPTGPGLRLHTYGVREWMPPGYVDRPSGTEGWLMVAFHTAAEIGIEDQPMAVPARSLVIWQPHSPHLLGQGEREWCHSWINCSGDEARELITEAAVPFDRPLVGIDPRWLDRCNLLIHDELRRNARSDPTILRNHLTTFLREVSRAVRGAASASAPPELLALRSHLEATFHERHTLRALAKRLGCSVPHLCNRFRRAFGASPIDYVIQLRLRHALYLLRERRSTVAGVARAVGYEDYHHFSKLFHRRFGRWPSDLSA
jgi:AraC-like DNA-binding protein